MRDGCSETADGCETILHTDLAFEAADLGEIVEGIDKSEVAAGVDVQGGDHNAKSFAESVAGEVADFGIAVGNSKVGQGILEKVTHRAAAQFGFGDFDQLLRRSIDQRDASVEAGGDNTSAHGLHDIFVKRLQIFERTAGVFELHVHLAQFAHEQAGEIGDGEVGKQIDEDDDLERLELGMRRRIGGNDKVVIEFEDAAEQDKGEGGAQISPDAGQQHAGDDDNEGVEKIERAVDASGDMDDEGNHGEVGEHLKDGLETMLAPDGNQKKKKQGKHEP